MEIDLESKTPDIRRLDDVRNVLFDKDWAKTAPDLELYYMYRGLKEENGIRYDITILSAMMLGKEFNKTKGHEHIGKYGEIYTVLEGEAIYLMQSATDNKISDAYAVMAKKGDFVIIPPGYGHVTINPSEKEDLKMANWMAANVKSDYSLFEKMQGACYYYTKSGWIKNENYKETPKLRFEQPSKSLPENLDFLKN
jgi:glucose-6-phosphate isomerase